MNILLIKKNKKNPETNSMAYIAGKKFMNQVHVQYMSPQVFVFLRIKYTVQVTTVFALE